MAETIFLCKHMRGAGWCSLNDGYCVEGPCGNADSIEYAPVRHGRWIETGYFDSFKVPIYKCSNPECMKEVADHYIENHKFCLRCGARMDGEA